MNSFLTLVGLGILLVLAQLLALLPWALFLGGDRLRLWVRQKGGVAKLLLPGGGAVLGSVLVVAGLFALFLTTVQDKATLQGWGRFYAAILQAQLIIDLLVALFVAMLQLWPKGGAVAMAAFREAVRQPMFWLFVLFAVLVLMPLAAILPFYTFGEDLVMMTEIDHDIIMILAVIFGVFTASISISDEIEGRTAVTLMSKPVSRRQFLLGKYFGILLAALLMTLLLGWFFNWMILGRQYFDKSDPEPPPGRLTIWLDAWAPAGEATDFLQGAGLWAFQTANLVPGLVLGFGQVMVLLAIAVSLATRLPMIVNVPICVLIYFLGHLTPTLTLIAQHYKQNEAPGSAVAQMLSFMANLFDQLLPSLEYFRPGLSALIGQVTIYGVLYTIIILLLGLILFEDRDLA
jgi:ABC-type transport system involved in multi-copper enzyme maturation permease subunit